MLIDASRILSLFGRFNFVVCLFDGCRTGIKERSSNNPTGSLSAKKKKSSSISKGKCTVFIAVWEYFSLLPVKVTGVSQDRK